MSKAASTIYIVVHGSYSDQEVMCAFTTLALAEAYCDAQAEPGRADFEERVTPKHSHDHAPDWWLKQLKLRGKREMLWEWADVHIEETMIWDSLPVLRSSGST